MCKASPPIMDMITGKVYKISIFKVIPNVGVRRFTGHKYRLIFTRLSKIIPTEDSTIRMISWTFYDTLTIRNCMSFTHLIGAV